VGGVIGAEITFCIFTINTNHGNTTQAFRRATLFQHKCLISAFNLHLRTHYQCFDILHLKQINFLRILVIFEMKNRFWFWAPHSLTPAVFFTTTLTSHGTLPLMKFLWIKLSFRTCKFFGYFLTQYETSIIFTKNACNTKKPIMLQYSNQILEIYVHERLLKNYWSELK
jgi:hypothetical protein